MKFLKDIINKVLGKRLTKEMIFYLIAGVLTTVVNFVCYYICKAWFTQTVSNIIAWAVSVLFAYAVNSRKVFEAKPEGLLTELRQLFEFALARVISGAVESGCVFVFVENLHYNDFWVKALVSVFVIVFNYAASKLVIFRSGR